MRPLLFTILCFCIVNPSLFSQKGTYSESLPVEFANNRLKIKFKSAFQEVIQTSSKNTKGLVLGIEDVDRLNAELGCEKIDFVKASGVVRSITLEFAKPIDLEKAVNVYTKTGKFDYVEPDFIGYGAGKEICPPEATPNDANFSNQWSLKNIGSFSLATAVTGNDIKAVEAWDITTGSSSVVVCIIDSGAKLDHPDFEGRIWINTKETGLNTRDDDTNGKIDDLKGWDFAYNDNDPTDDHGHGTNVAGIIGANGNNGIGYAGVDWKCKLMMLKGLKSDNSGLYSWWESAIYYAVDNGAKVINMSLIGSGNSSSLEAAVNYAWNKGVVVVVCMGNDNTNALRYPAAFNNVIAVGSTNPNGKKSTPFFWGPASGSNYGSFIDVCAPGNYIFGLKHDSNTNFNSYWGGTSQATPHAAGLAALMLAKNPKLTPAQLKDLMQKGCDDQTGDPTQDIAGFDNHHGWGRINAKKTLGLVPTGLKDLADESTQLQVFPNPSKGVFTLSSASILRGGTLEISTITGQIILSKSLQNTDNQLLVDIDLSNQANGVYFIHIKNSETFMSKKIVKN
jgi:thermitase